MDDAAPRVPARVARASPAPRRRLAGLALRRSWPSFAAAGVVTFVLIRLAFKSGGYFPAGYVPAAAIVFAALAVLLVVHVPRWTFPTGGLIALASLTGYAAWTGLSATWSPDPAAALQDLQRDALYVGLLALGLIAAGSGRHARLLPWTALLVLFVVCGAALLSRLTPEIVHSPIDPTAKGRLSYPLSYWNTLGGMAAMGTVLALGLASDSGGSVIGRAVAAAATVPFGATVWFSLSRGSWLALILGVVVLVTFGHHRGSVLLTLVVVAGVVGLVILRARSYVTLTEHPGSSKAQSEGHQLLAQVALLSGAVGVVVGMIAAGRRSAGLQELGRTVGRPVVVALGSVLVVFAVVVYAAKTTKVEGAAAKRGVSVSTWVSAQWREFLAPTSFSTTGTARLTNAKGTRSDLYRVAFDGFRADPLRGDGAGGFTVRWFKERRVDETVVNAHSLEIETLGELGLPGFVLLLGFIGAVVAAGVRARMRPGAMSRAQAASVVAALSAWLLHSGVDWDWQMPALTGVAILMAASVFPTGRKRVRRETSPPAG